MPSKTEKSKRSKSQAVGILMSAAVIPRTFQQSLMPRSTVDQGIITGLTMAMVYIMGELIQDGINEASESLGADDEDNGNAVPLLASLIAVGTGLLIQKKFKYSEDEPLTRSATRTSGYWLKYVGIAGSLVSLIEMGNKSIGSDSTKSKQRELLPLFIGTGIIYSMVGEYFRVKSEENLNLKSSILAARPLRAVGIGVGVAGALGAITYAERTFAKQVDSILQKRAPKMQKSSRLIGHLVAAGSMAFLVSKFMQRTYNKIEQSAEEFEVSYLTMPESELVSGSMDSNVPWSSLSIMGRRHLLSRLTAENISSVMNVKSVEPIRLFIGLDSADSEEDRVQLALDELERTKAYEKETILVVSPTGTGYVNYVFSESLEYMSKGNIASVTIQYSKRPSPMSLDRVGEGHIQYRMLLNGISKRVQTLPKNRRPRIVLFGESLGAWTSQDALMHSGTDGLKSLGIERALWIGTPKGSKWKDQIISKKWLNADPELIGIFDNFQEALALRAEKRNKLRYFMVTHYNDPIAQFGLELLIKQPEWVENQDKRPIGLSPNVKYRTPALFIQMLIDMKNALKPIPGDFVASGHDYRGDLARFSALAFGYKVSNNQLEQIDSALRNNEIMRAELIGKGKASRSSTKNKTI